MDELQQQKTVFGFTPVSVSLWAEDHPNWKVEDRKKDQVLPKALDLYMHDWLNWKNQQMFLIKAG